MRTLLCSAPSETSLLEGISRFYCGEAYYIRRNPDSIYYSVVRTSDGKVADGVFAYKRGARWRFEMGD